MIAEGLEGAYAASALDPVPAAQRDRWFAQGPTRGGERIYVARDELKALVAFRELNLIGSWPMRGKFQVIFCRNVVIYFNDQTQSRVWSRFAPLLEAPGVLYIGHSERVTGPAAAVLAPSGVTTYSLKTGGAG
jgi:chemotaxis protein methyltransferase CheR